MNDKWQKKWMQALKDAKNDVDFAEIIDKIYMDAYADGVASELERKQEPEEIKYPVNTALRINISMRPEIKDMLDKLIKDTLRTRSNWIEYAVTKAYFEKFPAKWEEDKE